MPSPTIKGLTTIKWGSSGSVTTAALTNAIVARMSASPKNGAAIEIEDNDGFAKAMVLLDDGFDATLECVYDSAITWPAVGATVTLQRPQDATALNCLLASIESVHERKKEAMLTLKLHYRPGVTLA